MLRQPNGPARPDTFGSRLSSGTTASSSTISPVTEVRSDSLPSIFGVEKPLVPRSTMKPRILPSSLAQTMREVGDRRVGDPHLGAVELEAAGDLLGARHHRAGIGAEVRLGQAEAADQLGLGELGQIFLLLRLAAVGVDRVHHQRGLHRQRRAVAGIDALQSRARSGRRRRSPGPRRRIPPGWSGRAGRARPSRAAAPCRPAPRARRAARAASACPARRRARCRAPCALPRSARLRGRAGPPS